MKVEKSEPAREKEEGEESLSSLSDDSDVKGEDGDGDDCTNIVLCQFETVKKTKNQWKVKLRHGLLTTGTQDYRFAVAQGTLTRW